MTTGNNMQANAPWETQLSISTACDQFDLASIEALTKQAVHDLPALMAAQDPRAARMIRTLMGSMKGLVVATDGPRRRKAERAVALIAPYLMDMANEWANDGDVEYGVDLGLEEGTSLLPMGSLRSALQYVTVRRAFCGIEPGAGA
eukprot:2303212-Prymnesium_polylepis.1